ncbi:hypothetical protein CHARACLAT_029730 [Characodon lateralis]|uniref:Uncharacterized protein n=1 Tax=Characodon lateralis TaxID=208331 RepID=A0ABU7DWK1_9TELE|nr:hypothetical protein [Characodon lateralis]
METEYRPPGGQTTTGRGDWTYLIFRNSSQSHRIRFMCLSKALKVPMNTRPSCRMHLILKSMCCSILLLFPTVWQPIRDNSQHDIIVTSQQFTWTGDITLQLRGLSTKERMGSSVHSLSTESCRVLTTPTSS